MLNNERDKRPKRAPEKGTKGPSIQKCGAKAHPEKKAFGSIPL